MGVSDTMEKDWEEYYREMLKSENIADYEKALEWVKKISKYGEYRSGYKNWSNDADEYIPILEKAIDKAERYDDLCE